MRINLGAISVVIFLIWSACPCQANVTVVPISGVGMVNENIVVSGERQITVTGSPCSATTFNITATSGSEPIRYIKIKSAGCAASSETFVNILESGGTITYIRSIEKITASPSADSEVRIASINISGGLGDPGSPATSSITADSVNTIVCGGEITANITVGPRLGGGTSNIVSIQSGNDVSGNIRAESGGVTEVVAAGDISGSIVSDTASIGTISAGGNIGGPIQAVNGSILAITAVGNFTTTADTFGTFRVRAKDGIDTIVANSITADITACAGCTSTTGGTGVVGLVKTTGGDFDGRIALRSLSTSTFSLNSGVFIAGDLTARVDGNPRIKVIGGGSVTQPITITGSLDGKIQYEAAGALTNQVIINSTNSGGAWNGSVLVDGVTLNTPYYSTASGTLGGGAVGLAPFHLYDNDCDPPNGATGYDVFTPFTLRFYGPVTWSSGSPVVVSVSKPNGSPPQGGSFSASVSAGSNPREVVVTLSQAAPVFDQLLRVTVVPNTGVLKCDQVTGNPNVGSFTYQIWN